MRSLTLLMVFVLWALLCAGCGGGGSSAGSTDEASIDSTGLPDLASLTRDSSVVDNDTAYGNSYIDALYQTDIGTAITLDSRSLATGDFAFAVYSIAGRSGETPAMITVYTLYYDEDPYEQGEFEGYWIAYGDFSDGDGVWRFDGPHMQGQARIAVPDDVDVTNDSGNIYVAVILADGSRMNVGHVQIGYDAGEGYEAYRLAATRGVAVGDNAQVEIDGDGQPQIAYLSSQVNYVSYTYTMKIASLVGGEWELENVPLSYTIENRFAFACGSNGRRALAVIDDDTDDLHLLFDDGSGGGFTDVGVVWASHTQEVTPDIAFINSTDDPTGELDTALLVHTGTYASPTYNIDYYRYDGVNPALSGTILAARQPGQLNLMVEDNQATLAQPVMPSYPQIDATFIQYSAATNVWAASAIGDWLDLDMEDDTDDYGFRLLPLGGGEYAGAFFSEDEDNIIFGKWDGATWTEYPEQQTSCARPMPWLDIDMFSDGTVVFPTYYSAFNLMVYEGVVGGSDPLEYHSLAEDGYTAFDTSIAVGPDGTAHIAVYNTEKARLDYYAYHQGGTADAPQIIDNGGDGFGYCFGPTDVVYTEDALHVFSLDGAHLRLLHSENRDGVWVRESEAIAPFTRYAYLIMGAGYLENTGQLWVAFLDIMDMNVYISYADPVSGGEWDWHTYYACFGYERLVALADDETNIGYVYITLSYLLEGYFCFAYGPPGTTPTDSEVMGVNFGIINPPLFLSYNKHDDTWNLLTRDDAEYRGYLWHRESAGNWLGPNVVAYSTAPDDNITPCGITYHEETGLARVLVYQEDDSAGRFNLSIYGQQALGSWEFSPGITVIDEDETVTRFGGLGCVPDEDGNPFIAVLTKLASDTTYDIDFYQYDGLGNWNVMDTWDSPFQTVFFTTSIMCYPLAIDPDGHYAFAATEMDESASTFGRVWVYYPW